MIQQMSVKERHCPDDPICEVHHQLLQNSYKIVILRACDFFRPKDGYAEVAGVVEGRHPRRPNNRAIRWQQFYAYNDPLLFVIPSEARTLLCASIPPRFPRANLPPIPTEPISPQTPLFLSPDTFCSLRAKPTCPGVPWRDLRCAIRVPKFTGLQLPSLCHPERLTDLPGEQRLRRGVEEPRRCLSCQCCLNPFDHPGPRTHSHPGSLCSLMRKHRPLVTPK